MTDRTWNRVGRSEFDERLYHSADRLAKVAEETATEYEQHLLRGAVPAHRC